MNRQIKFRGRVISGRPMAGQVVYGDLIHAWADDEKYPKIRVHEDYVNGVAVLAYFEVEPDSVAQLIAVGKNGNEIYEGDKVLRLRDLYNESGLFNYEADRRALSYPATFKDYAGILDGDIIFFEAALRTIAA